MRKNVLATSITFVSVLALALVLPASVLGHSGGTSSDGGHYCWTNCDAYGVPYGQRHFHQDTTPSPVTAPVKKTEKNETTKKVYLKIKRRNESRSSERK